jgi:hypothetical protein
MKMDPEVVAFFERMSGYEQADLYYTTRDSTILLVTTFMSALFAYIAVAHIAAKQFTGFQTIAISLIYSLFVMFLLSGIFPSMEALHNLTMFLFGDAYAFTIYGFPTLLLLSWVVSLLFMYQARKREDI